MDFSLNHEQLITLVDATTQHELRDFLITYRIDESILHTLTDDDIPTLIVRFQLRTLKQKLLSKSVQAMVPNSNDRDTFGTTQTSSEEDAFTAAQNIESTLLAVPTSAQINTTASQANADTNLDFSISPSRDLSLYISKRKQKILAKEEKYKNWPKHFPFPLDKLSQKLQNKLEKPHSSLKWKEYTSIIRVLADEIGFYNL